MKISIVGSGNIAACLGKAFYRAGHEIAEVFSRSAGHAGELAGQVNARPVSRLSQLGTEIDCCLIAVKDDAIEEVAQSLKFTRAVVAHTAGSISMEALAGSSPDYGVFYPFQTFSRDREPDTSQVPFCLEASNAATYERLEQLAASIRGKVYRTDSRQRKVLHLAGAFACNFTNHFYAIAEELLREEGLSFDMVRPLIRETAEKALAVMPREAQTGPAVRNDQKVISAHLALLERKPRLQELYRLISAGILNHRST